MRPDTSQSFPWMGFESSPDDYSRSFAKIRRHLVDSRGVRLTDYVRQLTPKYWRVYLDIGVGYAAIAGSLFVIGLGQAAGIWPPLLIAGGAALVGYWFFYLLSFLHEGAHWNLARDKSANDLVCDVVLSWMIGVNIDTYRRHHFEHHRFLGTIRDTAISYFFPLNVKAVLKSLLGIRAIEALLLYLKGTKQRAAGMTRGAQTTRALAIAPASRAVILGAAVHCLILGGLWLSGWSAAALAWILGVGGVMPLLNTIRQVLEHRTMDARAEIDYARTNQGACARIFGTGLFASTFGSAGANRHLLHHWEPEISYTRLAELERFLADTPMHVVMEKRRTTYYAAFRSLLSR